jgi:hypothetical protein
MVKATPMKNIVEMKKQYVPLPKINRSNSNTTAVSFSAPITQINTTVDLPA